MCQLLTRFFTALRCGVLTTAEAFHFTVRIGRGAATRPCRATYLATIVLRAISDAAFHAPIFILHRAAAFFGTEHSAVLIRYALTFSAHDISVRVLDAIAGIDLGPGDQSQKATNKQSDFHETPFDTQTQFRAFLNVAEV